MKNSIDVRVLGGEDVASMRAMLCGGVAAYLLPKFEQARSELYIYASTSRR